MSIGATPKITTTPAARNESSVADDSFKTVTGPLTPQGPLPPDRPASEIGRYRIIRELGRGGMGVVYEAEDASGKSRVALKTLPPDRPGSLLRFKDEFRALQNVVHEHLIRMLDLDTSASLPFFTMELIEGPTFLQYVRAGFDSNRPGDEVQFDEKRLRQGLRQLALAVKAVHDAGKLHRDIKPSNVMVRQADESVVLLDFGLAVNFAPSECIKPCTPPVRRGTWPRNNGLARPGRPRIGTASA